MGNKRVRRFKPEPDEVAITIETQADITEAEAEAAARKFSRKHGREYPRLAAALNAAVEEVEDANDTV